MLEGFGGYDHRLRPAVAEGEFDGLVVITINGLINDRVKCNSGFYFQCPYRAAKRLNPVAFFHHVFVLRPGGEGVQVCEQLFAAARVCRCNTESAALPPQDASLCGDR